MAIQVLAIWRVSFCFLKILSFYFILCKKLGEMELLSSSSVRLFNGLSKYTDVTFLGRNFVHFFSRTVIDSSGLIFAM